MGTTPLIAILIALIHGIAGENIQVTVSQGSLQGEKLQTVLGVEYYSFKGIPYAKPPTGNLRFKAPEEPESWTGVRNATEHGSICPQYDILTSTYKPGSENCLFLNVYTPSCNDSLPVLFFIHGGAFMFGSGNVDVFGPDFIVDKVVLVTINYRLSTLGFLSLENCDVPGNAGLKDQVAALKWVQNNIANFGGNPNNVTLFGETAGGSSVGYHLLSTMSAGLFHRAISMSGGPFNDFQQAFQPARRALTLAKTLGYDDNNTTDLLGYLQSVSVEELINISVSNATVLASEDVTEIPFKMQPFTGVVVECNCSSSNFITEDPLKILKSSNVNAVPVIFGHGDQEAVLLISAYASTYLDQYKRYPEMFVPSKLLIKSPPETILKLSDKIINYYFGDKSVSVANIATFIDYASDASIVYDMHRFFRRWAKYATVYSFKNFAYTARNYYGQQGAAYNITGVAHFDTNFYAFQPASSTYNMTTVDTSSTAYKVIQQITDVIKNFTIYGNPTPEGSPVIWPTFDTSALTYMNFSTDGMAVQYAADNASYTFWESIFFCAGVDF